MLQVHMEVCNNGVRGRAPEKFCNPRPIIQWETPCLNIDMHSVLVEMADKIIKMFVRKLNRPYCYSIKIVARSGKMIETLVFRATRSC